MCRRRRSGGLTLVEVLILIGIAGCLVIMLLPAIQSARESARRRACLNNLRQLGVALRGYEGTHDRFPPSSGVTRNAEGAIIAVDGWSWLVAILPYWPQSMDDRGSDPVAKALYDSLDIAGGGRWWNRPAQGDAPCRCVGREPAWIVVPEFWRQSLRRSGNPDGGDYQLPGDGCKPHREPQRCVTATICAQIWCGLRRR